MVSFPVAVTGWFRSFIQSILSAPWGQGTIDGFLLLCKQLCELLLLKIVIDDDDDASSHEAWEIREPQDEHGKASPHRKMLP